MAAPGRCRAQQSSLTALSGRDVGQFPFQALAILDVHGLDDDELRQQTARCRDIVPVALQFGDEPRLPGNMLFARGHVLAGSREMPELGLPVHCLRLPEA